MQRVDHSPALGLRSVNRKANRAADSWLDEGVLYSRFTEVASSWVDGFVVQEPTKPGLKDI